MKNQYFGDINDYLKYGLLRSIISASGLQLLVVWMLTPDDGSSDGRQISYLEHPAKWSKHDPLLFEKLKGLLSNNDKRQVSLIEGTGLLPEAKFFPSPVPDTAQERRLWFDTLLEYAQGSDLIFLDPDNGLEVKSNPYGRKNSSKYLYWQEVKALWSSGKSLLIYQHFVREIRQHFILRIVAALNMFTHGSLIETFKTSHVLFILTLQPGHQHLHEPILASVRQGWKGQIYQMWSYDTHIPIQDNSDNSHPFLSTP